MSEIRGQMSEDRKQRADDKGLSDTAVFIEIASVVGFVSSGGWCLV
jgi:hypothetical protein